MSILGTIDGAIHDHELAVDAMRWSPDPPAPPPVVLRLTLIATDVAAIRAGRESISRAVADAAGALRGMAVSFAGAPAAVRRALEPLTVHARAWVAAEEARRRKLARVRQSRVAYGRRRGHR